MSELKRCPLCNQAPWVGPAPESDAFEIMACRNRDCPLHEIYMATATWNTRPIEYRLERERDEAQKMLERFEREFDESQRDLSAARAELAEALAYPTKKPLVTYEHEGYHGRWISDTDHDNRMCAFRGERNRARRELAAARAEIERLKAEANDAIRERNESNMAVASFARTNGRLEDQLRKSAKDRAALTQACQRHTAEIARLNAVIAAQAEAKGE